MNPGDIVFVMHRDSWVSRTIAWFMASRWSHTALIFDSGRHVITTETNPYCVKHGTMTALDRDKASEYEVWSPIGMSDWQRREIVDRSIDWIDKPYGWLQLFSLGVRRLVMRIGLKIPNFIRQGLVCNHVVLYAYIGQIPQFPADPESIDTEELYQIVRGCGRFRLTRSKNGCTIKDVTGGF